MRAFGSLLQRVGLFLPPLAICLQLLPGNAAGGTVISLKQMLLLLVAAACCFWIGRILEGYGRH